MPGIILTIKSARTDLASILTKSASCRNEFYTDMISFLQGMKGRAEEATTYYQLTSADPVAAYATVTIDNSKLAAADYITIAGVTITCKASGAGANEFNKGSSSTASATNMAAAINASTSTAGLVKASSSAGVVTITCKVRGVIGNQLTLTKSEGTPSALTLSGATLANGTGAPSTEVSFY